MRNNYNDELTRARINARALAQTLHCNCVAEFIRLGKEALVEINIIRAKMGA